MAPYCNYTRFPPFQKHPVTSSEISRCRIDAMQEHYDRYINLHNSVTVFKLKPDEDFYYSKHFWVEI